MLAGRVKQSTFLAVVGIVALGGIVGAYFACNAGGDDLLKKEATAPPKKEPSSARPSPKPAPTRREAPAPAPDQPSSGDGPSQRPVDEAVMRFLGKALGTTKKKDVTSGQPFKVNVYQDAGNDVANRAKVDLDRDDKWDEKWTFKAGEISRKVSTNDDEKYDEEVVWRDGAWAAR